MQIRPLAVRFTETAAEEVKLLVKELSLIPLAQQLQRNDQSLSEEFNRLLAQLLTSLSDLFSVDLPGTDKDPEATLRTISRDINLARLLRERGLFRLYRLIHQKDAQGIPLFMTLVNPDTGSPFGRQEEFIGWFCQEARVARSLVFIRIATIERILALGFSLEEAFKLILTKPYAIRETMNLVADWEKGELKAVDPNVLVQVAERVSPESLARLEPVAEAARQNPTDPAIQQELRDVARSVIASLLSEVANHDRAKDALDFVRYDVLAQPAISYSWDEESEALVIELVRKQVDPETGEEYDGRPITVPFVPDAAELPVEIKADLLKRLPIRNRYSLDVI